MSDTSRRSQTALRQAVHYRNYRRIRDRALRRLAHQSPDQYRLFLEEERVKDEADGKSWLDISGRTKRSMGSSIPSDRQGGISKRHPNGDDEEDSDNGGEA